MLFLFAALVKMFLMKIVKYIFLFILLIFSVVISAQNKTVDSLTSVLQKAKNDIDKAQLLNAIADEYKSSDPKLLLQYATQALQLSTKIKYKLAEGNAYLNFGNANIISGNYPVALQYFSKAQAVFETELESNPENSKEIKRSEERRVGKECCR